MKKLFAFLMVLFALGIYTDVVPIQADSAQPSEKMIQVDQLDIHQDNAQLKSPGIHRSETLFMRAFLLNMGSNPIVKESPSKEKTAKETKHPQPFSDLHYDPGSCGRVIV